MPNVPVRGRPPGRQAPEPPPPDRHLLQRPSLRRPELRRSLWAMQARCSRQARGSLPRAGLDRGGLPQVQVRRLIADKSADQQPQEQPQEQLLRQIADAAVPTAVRRVQLPERTMRDAAGQLL